MAGIRGEKFENYILSLLFILNEIIEHTSIFVLKLLLVKIC